MQDTSFNGPKPPFCQATCSTVLYTTSGSDRQSPGAKIGLGSHRTAPSWPRFGPSARNGEMSDETRRIEEVVIPLAEESASVSKREVETGQVRVALSTDIETVIARETLRGCKIEIERVPVNRVLPDGEPVPQSRQEGDTLVIPVVEEKAVVVKRLVVTEEGGRRFVTAEVTDETPFEEKVSVRRQRATVDRVTPNASDTDPAMIRRDAS